MFYWSSQDHELVHKTIRRLTIEYCLVKTFFGRYTVMRWFTALDYAYLFEQINWEKRLKIHAFKRRSFIQTDNLRELYNSFTMDNGEKLKKRLDFFRSKQPHFVPLHGGLFFSLSVFLSACCIFPKKAIRRIGAEREIVAKKFFLWWLV